MRLGKLGREKNYFWTLSKKSLKGSVGEASVKDAANEHGNK